MDTSVTKALFLEQPDICRLEFQFNKWLNERQVKEQKFCFTAVESDARLLFAGIRVAGLLDWEFHQEENQFCLAKPGPEIVSIEDFFKLK